MGKHPAHQDRIPRENVADSSYQKQAAYRQAREQREHRPIPKIPAPLEIPWAESPSPRDPISLRCAQMASGSLATAPGAARPIGVASPVAHRQGTSFAPEQAMVEKGHRRFPPGLAAAFRKHSR
jgi:hypothetical protein